MEVLEGIKLAHSTVEQILTLSTALLTLTVTFAKDYLLRKEGRISIPLGLSWLFLFLSIFTGVWSLLALTGELENEGASIWNLNVIFPAFMMSVFFCAGIGCTVLAGWYATYSPKTTNKQSPSK